MKTVFLILLALFAGGGADWARADNSGQQFQGFNLQGYTDDGKKAWVVNGDKADISGSDIKISNVDAESYGDEIKHQHGLSLTEANIQKLEMQMLAIGVRKRRLPLPQPSDNHQ